MDTKKFNSLNTKVIAHRGLSGIERENTCPAFVAAGNRSYFGIETDVHVTKDGQFVIIHDETTERVSLGKYNINVEENDYSAVKDISLPDLDSSFARQDIRIPLLSEYIKICKKYGKICVLEVKNPFTQENIIRLVDEIRELDYLESVIFISFDFNNCLMLRKLLPSQKIQWLTSGEITDGAIENLVNNKLDIDVYYERLNEKLIEKLHSYGIEVNAWTCDSQERAEELAKFGIDFITTNILE
ncbi:MAG: glycerophosphodiester phosphodiesterase [Clostridia bacterium]|nr:glycerophosphodiester phosphodiesterase [Clostridia bacterium]